MFHHDKLDWTLKRLEQQANAQTDDVSARVELARACLSKAMFHEGGEIWFNKALTHARRAIASDPGGAVAHVVAGLALVGLDRLEPAEAHLDEALKREPERADVHLGWGALAWRQGERLDAMRSLENACRLAPESWETHWMLGRLLVELAEEVGGSKRLQERSQYHIVRALTLGPNPETEPALLHELGVACLRGGRLEEAHKLFARLIEVDRYKSKARYYQGLVMYGMGKHKNAIMHLRRHLEERPDAVHVHARIGMAYLALGEVSKARESCHRALALDPSDLQARWTLASAWLEEGQTDEAMRELKAILSDAPDHLPAFTEMVRIKQDPAWLRTALRAEVTGYDRLPVRLQREHPSGRGRVEIDPRATTRARIQVLTQALGEVDASLRSAGQPGVAVRALVECLDLTTDEGLRFQLWDSALNQLSAGRAQTAVQRLEQPGRHYAAAVGREILVLAHSLPEHLLHNGLKIGEGDLKRAAVDRNDSTRDVSLHRANIERERQEARAWQALLLLALASRDPAASRNLLVRWASDADGELADAARAGLALGGDRTSADALRPRARARGAEHLVDELLARSAVSERRYVPRPVSDDERATCATCGRTTQDADHLLAGPTLAICSHCLTEIARNRAALATDDPTVPCVLTGRTLADERAVYVLRGVAVAHSCVEQSLGLQEREEVDRYLAAL